MAGTSSVLRQIDERRELRLSADPIGGQLALRSGLAHTETFALDGRAEADEREVLATNRGTSSLARRHTSIFPFPTAEPAQIRLPQTYRSGQYDARQRNVN